MKIVHFSDWHNSFHKLPEADLYICTGDMFDNYPVRKAEEVSRPFQVPLWHYTIDKEYEKIKQAEWCKLFTAAGGFRQYLGSPDAPIVCVRGNHDFINIAPMFKDCNLVHEFVGNELIEVLKLKITGHQGIPLIFNGTWNDETPRPDLTELVNQMPHADIFLTHYPPHQVLDSEEKANGHVSYYGLEKMKETLIGKMGERGLHCFGHIHGSGAQIKEFGAGQIVGSHGPLYIFSNAATTYNEIEF